MKEVVEAKLTLERLRERLDYNPQTGVFVWKTKGSKYSRVKVGAVAGSVAPNGYVNITIDGSPVPYLAHRLAWFYTYGCWPNKQLDHKNTIRSDNHIENLREADYSQNQANRRANSKCRTGSKGVCYRPKNTRRPWVAFIQKGADYTYLGAFAEQDEAAEAYARAASDHYGEFARGRR